MVDSEVVKQEYRKVSQNTFTIRKDQEAWLEEKAKSDEDFNKSEFVRKLLQIAMIEDTVKRPDYVFVSKEEQTGIWEFVSNDDKI